MKNLARWVIDCLLLPLLGAAAVLSIWSIASGTFAKDLPSPGKAWEDSRLYVMEPFAYRGELDQGIGRFTWLSLQLVARGYGIALLIGTPRGRSSGGTG